MKKIAVVLTTLAMAACLTACGSAHCKESGCENEVYQDGYCEYHYAIHAAEEIVGNAAGDIMNSLLG